MKTSRILIFLIFAAAAFGAAGFYIYKDFTKIESIPDSVVAEPEQEQKKDASQKSAGESAAADKQQSTAAIVEKISAKVPDLSKPIEIKTEIPEEIKEKTISEIKAISESLKKDYNSLGLWLQLGLLRKSINDFDGAREAWEFASFVDPASSIPFHNLGFLYWQYLKDFKKSEDNYLKAIANNSKDMAAYVDLSNVYYFNLNDKNKAEEILIKGLEKNHNNQELLAALRELRKIMGE